ncbi:hypothetical protein [Ehrlichia minasensis]|nr:hypothetical protein [Ehrlichia minasensis]
MKLIKTLERGCKACIKSVDDKNVSDVVLLMSVMSDFLDNLTAEKSR